MEQVGRSFIRYSYQGCEGFSGKGNSFAIQGRVRDVSYTLNYVESDTRVADFTDSVLINRDGNDYISSMYKKQKTVEERISPLDKMRFEQKEMSIDDLVYKYFAYLIG